MLWVSIDQRRVSLRDARTGPSSPASSNQDESIPTVTQISLLQKERNTKDGKTEKPIIMIGLMIIS